MKGEGRLVETGSWLSWTGLVSPPGHTRRTVPTKIWRVTRRIRVYSEGEFSVAVQETALTQVPRCYGFSSVRAILVWVLHGQFSRSRPCLCFHAVYYLV